VTSWNGEPALEIAGAGLTMIIVPGRGGKIVSLVDDHGTEWLLGPPDRLPAPARPGARFIEAEMCGWDECAPTIDVCRLADGTELPEHGDLWTAAWSVRPGAVGDSTVSMEVGGTALPYTLRREVLATDTGLELRYRVTADRPIPFLWAAHPQFLAPLGTMIELPPEIDRVIDVYREPGVEHRWDTGLASIDTVPEGTGRKVYLPPTASVGTAALRRPDGRALRLTWDPAIVPYLGFWYDRSGFARADVIAIEPSTGYYDSLVEAVSRGRVSTVMPDRPLEWTVTLELGEPSPT
jgi:galactose mutarotase-like enzyme